MVITLIRDKFTAAETLGKMLIDRVPFCGTLEPPTVPNATHPKGCNASTQGTHATILPVAYWLANAPSGHSHCRNPKTLNKPLLNNS